MLLLVGMGAKLDYKRDYRHLYVPEAAPHVLDVPSMPFLMLDGSGDPNGERFAREVEALYSLSYAVRMSYKSDDVPAGYYPYTVFPLEGVWDLLDRSKSAEDKRNLRYSLMIRQPDFLTDESFKRYLERTMHKKPNPFLERVRFERMTDGLSCQMLHVGPFDDEPKSFAKMEAFCAEQGYVRASKIHREIYLSDPRKTEPARMKTVLRFPVRDR